jgi:hypothetical protein
VVLKEDLLMMKTPSESYAGGFFMSAIILTGLSHNGHKFSLTYPEIDGEVKCFAHCTCGYEVEILYFKNYGGIKYLQKMWEMHIGTWKGWI